MSDKKETKAPAIKDVKDMTLDEKRKTYKQRRAQFHQQVLEAKQSKAVKDRYEKARKRAAAIKQQKGQ